LEQQRSDRNPHHASDEEDVAQPTNQWVYPSEGIGQRRQFFSSLMGIDSIGAQAMRGFTAASLHDQKDHGSIDAVERAGAARRRGVGIAKSESGGGEVGGFWRRSVDDGTDPIPLRGNGRCGSRRT
jgi:hypothetical protein